MDSNLVKIAYGALLHDIGKVVQRADQTKEKHAKIGGDWFDGIFSDHKDYDKEITDQIRYHHAKELNAANLDSNSLAYITYFADNIASGVDRRSFTEEDSSYFNWNSFTNMEDIFNVFLKESSRRYYEPIMIEDDTNPNFPKESNKEYSKGIYAGIKEKIRSNLTSYDLDKNYIQSLINLLEATLSYVPSSTNMDEVTDISLFDHSKLVTAFASSLYRYFDSKGITDYKDQLFKNGDLSFYDEEAFLLVSFDLSGIQKFIYTIVSSGAAKQLRARSFYLEMMSEQIVDSLLERLHLTRANLIYNGGGHAYLICDNSEETKTIIDEYAREYNDYLIEYFGTDLYVAFAYEPFCANQVMLKYKANNYEEVSKSYQQIYKDLSRKLSAKKVNRYDATTLMKLNSSSEPVSNECKICHSTKHVDGELCHVCDALATAAPQIRKKEYFVISDDVNGLPVGPNKFLSIMNKKEVMQALKEETDSLRVYRKNKFMGGINQNVHLWVGDYYAQDEFSSYVDRSDKGNIGIKRLGVVRLDVDDLGYAFMAGFSTREDGKYNTFGRSATFSRSLSLFFKFYINKFAEGKDLSIIYSGGDDVFAIGSWDDIIDFTIDLREKFIDWTNGKLTLSAGIGMYSDKTPVNIMARDSGELEKVAKDNTKDSVTLFNSDYCFKFDEFINHVYKDKYEYINNFFESQDERGKAFIYKLLELLRGANNKDKISIARLAYLLARLEPKKSSPNYEMFNEFKKNVYEWANDEEHRKELELALTLYVYKNRKE